MNRRLNPGGVVTVFVQLYEAGTEAVKSEIATFFEAFPNGTIWANTLNGRGYDLVLMGQVDPMRLDVARLEDRLRRAAYSEVQASLAEIGIGSAVELLSTYAGRAGELGPWLEDAEINRDRNLRLQYLAGLGVNRYEQDLIYRRLVSYLEFPESLFVGSEGELSRLRSRLAN